MRVGVALRYLLTAAIAEVTTTLAARHLKSVISIETVMIKQQQRKTETNMITSHRLLHEDIAGRTRCRRLLQPLPIRLLFLPIRHKPGNIPLAIPLLQ
jgi:hypothetical protein